MVSDSTVWSNACYTRHTLSHTYTTARPTTVTGWDVIVECLEDGEPAIRHQALWACQVAAPGVMALPAHTLANVSDAIGAVMDEDAIMQVRSSIQQHLPVMQCVLLSHLRCHCELYSQNRIVAVRALRAVAAALVEGVAEDGSEDSLSKAMDSLLALRSQHSRSRGDGNEAARGQLTPAQYALFTLGSGGSHGDTASSQHAPDQRVQVLAAMAFRVIVHVISAFTRWRDQHWAPPERRNSAASIVLGSATGSVVVESGSPTMQDADEGAPACAAPCPL